MSDNPVKQTAAMKARVRKLRAQYKRRVTAAAIVCFHPTFVLMGGSFGNDMLSVLFILLSLLLALRWYEESTLRRILPLAFSIGLGMMAKLSA